MAYEQREMSGALFKNDKREKDTHPHARGSCLIDGVEYWIDAWTKEGQRGKWQSLSFKRKDKQPAQDTRTHGERKRPAHDDDAPF
jgi:type II secretory pathway component PulJ